MYRALFSHQSQIIGAYPDTIEVVREKNISAFNPVATAILFLVGVGVGFALGGVGVALAGGVAGLGVADMIGLGLASTLPLSLKVAK